MEWKERRRLKQREVRRIVCKMEPRRWRGEKRWRKKRKKEREQEDLLAHSSITLSLPIEAFISRPLLMWLIEQISRKQRANCVRPAILRRLVCKYYPWMLVLETRIYIKHNSERCQPRLAAASVSPEGGPRRNSLACVPLYDFPPEAIPAERRGRKYIINLLLLIYFLVDSSQTALSPRSLPPPPFSPLHLTSIKTISGSLGCLSINMSAASGFCGAEYRCEFKNVPQLCL